VIVEIDIVIIIQVVDMEAVAMIDIGIIIVKDHQVEAGVEIELDLERNIFLKDNSEVSK